MPSTKKKPVPAKKKASATKQKAAPAVVVRSSRSRIVTKAAPAKPAKAPRAPRAAAAPFDTSALPPVLQTANGRGWAKRLAKEGWALATIPPARLVHLTKTVSREAASVLLSAPWTAIAEQLRANGVPVREPRAPKAPRARAAEGTSKRTRVEQNAKRPLVDDEAQAVRLDTLEAGEGFKTPDSVREGIRGHYGVVVRHGTGSTVVGGDFPFDYVAPGTLVVRLSTVEGC